MSTPQNQAQGQKQQPDKSAMDIHAASHKAAMTAAMGHGDALAKLHAAVVSTLGNQQPGQGDPNQQGGGDAAQQAVWQTFPSTDPQAVQQMLAQAQGDPHAALQALSQQQEQDMSALHEQQMARLAELLDQLGQPSPDAQAQAPSGPPPAVGGGTTGAY